MAADGPNGHFPANRIAVDVNLLSMVYIVRLIDNHEFVVCFRGPAWSLYRTGVWQVKVTVHHTYPERAPEIKFLNRIYHPNVNLDTGILCQTLMDAVWNPLTSDLLYVFNSLLVHLLCVSAIDNFGYVNNPAGHLLTADLLGFAKHVEIHCLNYANIPQPLVMENHNIL